MYRFPHHYLTIVTIALLCFLTPESLAQNATQEPPSLEPLPLNELRTFTSVFEHIRLHYVEDIDDKTLLEYAVRGMLAGLDPHSSYLDEDDFKAIQASTTGQFGGLGLEVTMEGGFVKVIAPLDDTPAKAAGIKSGDLIIKIDDQPVQGLSLTEAVDLMRGEKGSNIALTIVREERGQPFDVAIIRDMINVKSVRSEVLEPSYGYIRVAQFQTSTGAEFKKALGALQADDPPLQGLIIDLRNNPGGVLQSAIEVSDALLPEGLIVYTQGRQANSNTTFSASTDDLSGGIPIVVLINGGSASGSEIVAGALQDHRRAIIMGTQSFGKGSVQTIIPLTQDSAIKLTTALYYTPDGRSIQAQGIVPDIEVERATIERLPQQKGISEANLQGHLPHGDEAKRNRQEHKKTITDKDNDQQALAQQDNQLHDALNLLKGLYILGAHS